MTPRAAILLAVVAIMLLAACSGATATASPSDAPVSEPPPAPGEPGVPEPMPGEVELVEPQPGQQDVHAVTLDQIEATASGRTVTVDAYWTSGVAPCYVLDQVLVNVNDADRTVHLTVREGTSDPDAICIMIAVPKHTIVSFEVPSAGTWTIRDSEGGGQPVEVVVS